jgi:hypothetical protein
MTSTTLTIIGWVSPFSRDNERGANTGQATAQYADNGDEPVDYVDDSQIYEDEHGSGHHHYLPQQGQQQHHHQYHQHHNHHQVQQQDDYEYNTGDPYDKDYYEYHDNGGHRRHDGRGDMW